jgi:hypothetical protein
MPLDYDEAIAELRSEEKRLEEELNQVRAAIPGMIVLRNRSRSKSLIPAASATTNAAQLSFGAGRFAGVGTTKAIQALLKEAPAPLVSKEIHDALKAQGWTTGAVRPVGTVSATLRQLEGKHLVERVGEAWRIKTNLQRVSLNPASFSPNGSQQPS